MQFTSRLYGLCLQIKFRVVLMGYVYGSCFRAEYMGWVTGRFFGSRLQSNLRVHCTCRVYKSS